MDQEQTLLEARHRIGQAAQRPAGLCVLTGAGMSAESGIPTFRDARSGLWASFDPMALATPEGFRARPQLVWDWYEERRHAVLAAQPNAGHHALADFARRHPGVLRVVTQNVDDLHQRAGLADTLRLHGDILAHRWLDRCERNPACEVSEARPGRPPQCSRCGNVLRPDVVWFGESLPADSFAAAAATAVKSAVTLVVGTSGAVWPAAGLAGAAREAGAWVLIINPQASEIDDQVDAVLRGTAAHLLPLLLAEH